MSSICNCGYDGRGEPEAKPTFNPFDLVLRILGYLIYEFSKLLGDHSGHPPR